MRRWFLHPWLRVRVPFALGLVFIVAALPKVADPPGFAKAIYEYRLFPAWSIAPAALVVPWLELLAGAALCLGFRKRSAALWVMILLLAFLAALGINLGRDHPVDCGCFEVQGPAKTAAERLAAMRWDILRDLGLLLMALQAFAAGREPS
jgi:uncharacterized membrane protein YphA (DoxX/SURF4 family)